MNLIINRMSVRQLQVYSVESPGSALYSLPLDNSPSILIPYYDEGTSTMFLTGRVSMYIDPDKEIL